jgi:hypothetical protein
VHLAAGTVLMRCPEPLSELEVAVVLETCGYNASRVKATGASDLMELARAVYDLVPIYAPSSVAGSRTDRGSDTPRTEQSHWGAALEVARSFCKGLLFAAPLIVSLTTMLVAGVSFWSSSVELSSVARSVTLSACLALVFTGPFIHAFVRRASFYLPFEDSGMLAYLTRRVLGTGMLVAAGACVAGYLLRARLGTASPPAADRLGVAAGLAIAALQLGLSPFYLRNAVIPMAALVGGAGAALAWHTTHLGAFIDPVSLTVWQVRLVAEMAAAAWAVDACWLLRGGWKRRRSGSERRLWVPAGSAVVRAVTPYAVFGLAYFSLVSLPQLVSGGAWLGHYGFNGQFALASGLALVGLVPVAGFGNVAADRLTKHILPATLSHQRISAVERTRVDLRSHWRTQVLFAALAGGTAAVAVDVLLPKLAHALLASHGMAASPGLLYACSAGFLLLSIGTFASQLLFSLSSPGRPVVASLVGTAVLVATSGTLSLSGLTSLSVAAAVGFTSGCGVFAVLALLAGEKAFSEVDFTCYRAL